MQVVKWREEVAPGDVWKEDGEMCRRAHSDSLDTQQLRFYSARGGVEAIDS